jgi:hypothetical protein
MQEICFCKDKNILVIEWSWWVILYKIIHILTI